MIDGRIVKTGGHDLAHLIEREGYDKIREETGSRCLAASTPVRPSERLTLRAACRIRQALLDVDARTRALDRFFATAQRARKAGPLLEDRPRIVAPDVRAIDAGAGE